MKHDANHLPRDPADRSEQDDLWELLGKVKAPEVSPFFARNIVRQLREKSEHRSWLAIFQRKSWRWIAPTAAAAAVALAAFLSEHSTSEINDVAKSNDSVVLLAQQVAVSPDYQVINHLDELLDSEQNSAWLEN